MAQEVGVAYVTVMPSTKGFGKAVENEIADGAERGTKTATGKLGLLAGRIAKFGAAAVLTIGGAISALAIGGGISRALNIEDAEAKLAGLGHTTAAVSAIMDDALTAVKGTAFRLDAAATVAASAVAAGIKPGKQLEKYLRLTADAATIAGVELGEMGDILNKVTAKGVAQMDDLNRLTERGIPITQWLAEEYGVTQVALSKMVAQGKVDATTFRKVLEENLGGAALASGDTTRGAFANMGAALSRLGVTLISGFAPHAKTVFNELTTLIDGVNEAIKPFAEDFAKWFDDVITPALEGFGDRGVAVFDKFIDLVKQAVAWVKGLRDLWAELRAMDLQDIFDFITTALQNGIQFAADWLATGGIALIADAILSGKHAISDAVLELVPTVISALAEILPSLVSTVALAIVQAIALVPDLFISLAGAIPTLLATVLTAVDSVVDGLVDAIPQILAAVSDALPAILTSVLAAAEGIVGAIVDAIPGVVGALREVLPEIVATLTSIAPDVLDAAVALFSTLLDGLAEVLPGLLTTLGTEVLPQIAQTIADALPGLATLITDAVMQIAETLDTTLPPLIDVLAGSVLPQLVDTFVEISPQLVDAGIALMLALIEGLTEASPEMQQASAQIMMALVAALPAIIVAAFKANNAVSKAWADATLDSLGDVWKVLEQLPSLISSHIGDLSHVLLDAGRSLIQGLIDGIRGALGDLKEVLNGVTARLPDWKGPAHVDANILRPAGALVMGGFQAGIEDSLPGIKSTLGSLTTGLPSLVGTGGNAGGAGGSYQFGSITVVTPNADDFLRQIQELAHEAERAATIGGNR